MLEYPLQRNAEHFRDKKSDFQRWRVLPQFDSVDGLARDADVIGERLLSHFVVFLTQLPDTVGEVATHIRARA